MNRHVRSNPATASLAERFDPGSNSLAVIRLSLAAVVAVIHATAVGFGWQPVMGRTALGELAVTGFFVVSGFLVTRSYQRLDSFWRYSWHRFLRIMPGFWVCLLVSALVVAPVLAVQSGRPAQSVFTGDTSVWDYLMHNWFLFMGQYDVNGLPAHGHSPGVVDGALWTLFYEALCYAMIGALGWLGVVRSQRWLVLALGCLSWLLLVAARTGGVPVPGQHYLLPLTTAFLWGAIGFLFADRLPINDLLALALTVGFLLGTWAVPVLAPIVLPAFAYLCLWAMVRLPWRPTPPWDLSYGVYIFHYPIEQLLIGAGVLALLGDVEYVVLSLILAGLAAAVSWRLVERPALQLKDANWPSLSLRRAESSR